MQKKLFNLIAILLPFVLSAQQDSSRCPDIRTQNYFISVDKKFDSCFAAVKMHYAYGDDMNAAKPLNLGLIRNRHVLK